MKAIFFGLLLAATTIAQAQTTVPVIWPFASGSTQGVMVREIIQEANQSQKKFIFVFDHRPGSGGAIAVQHALNQREPAVLAHTNSYFTRPHMQAEARYDVNMFQMINSYCANQPLAFISKNISSLSELDRKKHINVGVLMGSITQLVTNEYAKQKPGVTFNEIGYKGTPEITLDVLAGHIDLSVDWLASVNNDQLRVLGITGTQNIGPWRTFRSQGIAGFDDLTNSYYLLINRSMDAALAAEIADILSRASQGIKVQQVCRQDFGTPVNVTGSAAQKLLQDRRDYWERKVKSLRPQ